MLAEPFLDIQERMVSLNSDYDERGLLGMAIHPAFAENGWLNEYLLSFGQDNNGEVYVLTTETAGPSGETGKVYQLTTP